MERCHLNSSLVVKGKDIRATILPKSTYAHLLMISTSSIQVAWLQISTFLGLTLLLHQDCGSWAHSLQPVVKKVMGCKLLIFTIAYLEKKFKRRIGFLPLLPLLKAEGTERLPLLKLINTLGKFVLTYLLPTFTFPHSVVNRSLGETANLGKGDQEGQ